MAAPTETTDDSILSNESDDLIIGPVLPAELLASRRICENESKVDNSDSEGARMTSAAAAVDSYGPALPPGYKTINDLPDKINYIGPALPPSGVVSTNASDDDDRCLAIGPLPPLATGNRDNSETLRDFERRAERMRRKLTNQDEPEDLKREEWMTVLPPELSKNFGLGPRTFQRREPLPKGDRSVWTDTPADKMKKATDVEITEKPESDADRLSRTIQQKYDEEMARRTELLNESCSRSESLMDLHKKKLKRKAKEDCSKRKERRPFDRDIDLKGNVLDNAKRSALIKQSSQLSSKFSCGKNQFL